MKMIPLSLLVLSLLMPAATAGRVENLRVVTINVWAGLEVTRSEVVLDRPLQGIHPSDHFGVMAEFEVQLPSP